MDEWRAPLRVRYRNWKGDIRDRILMPKAVWFGKTEWHPDPTWLLQAIDLEDGGKVKDFALKDFLGGHENG